jgi:hypothetical protein
MVGLYICIYVYSTTVDFLYELLHKVFVQRILCKDSSEVLDLKSVLFGVECRGLVRKVQYSFLLRAKVCRSLLVTG